jgi:hypothetical protein
MVFIEYLKQGIALFVGFGKATQYPSTFQVIEPNVFLRQPLEGIVGVLCCFEDEQYPSNSIDPWCFITNTLMEVFISF